MKTIRIEFIHPPIPDRRFDYCAYIEGEEEGKHCGYGPSAADAVKDFIENYGEDLDR